MRAIHRLFILLAPLATAASLKIDWQNDTAFSLLLNNETWLTGGAAARVFTRRAVALYEWGMADLGRRCLLRGPKARCRRHLSLNDVAVFKQLLVGDGEWHDPRPAKTPQTPPSWSTTTIGWEN